MQPLLLAGLFQGLLVLYLAGRGVEPGRIARILKAGLLTGAVIAVLFALAALARGTSPAAAIALAFALGALLAAARMARDEILGTITPAGIVMLNVAVNIASGMGPLPMSFDWLASRIPVPYGPLRIALNLLVLYAPALLALLLMRKGPPGSPLLRFVLGLWVCWVGIASIAGPGWSLVSGPLPGDMSRLIASGFAVYAAMHLVLIALNVLFMFGDRADDHAVSIARSVRVGTMGPLAGIAAGIVFGAAARVLLALEPSPDTAAAVILAVPFAIGELLSRGPLGRGPATGDDGVQRAAPRLPAAAIQLVVAIGGLALAMLLWSEGHPERRAARGMQLDPVTGSPVEFEAGISPFFRYEEPHLHARLRQGLERDRVPFAVQAIRGKEVFRVSDRHLAAAQRVRDEIEGPEVPLNRSAEFHDPAELEAFGAWLDAHGVGWSIVEKRGVIHMVWDPGERHDQLYSAYRTTAAFSHFGMDHYLLKVVAYRGGDGLNFRLRNRDTAAFTTTAHRDRFEAWLRQRGVEPRREYYEGHEFVTWFSREEHLVIKYRDAMRGLCDAPPSVPLAVPRTTLTLARCSP